MDKGGTKAPIKRKTSGFKVGDTIRCISAASPWYTVGEVYTVVEHPTSFLPSVVGSDGHHDELVLIISKFELYKGDKNATVTQKPTLVYPKEEENS